MSSSYSSSNIEKTLMSLVKAQNENEVEKILQDKLFAKMTTWKPLGGDNNNYSIISVQQANSINALCEKPINSIDAVLLKQCRLKDGDPTGPNVPKSMKGAVQKYFDIPDGNFANLDKEQVSRITDQNMIMIIADGERTEPNIIIVDKGEGQKPDDFEDTLLSLAKGNKKKIKFVQGKYNMGGTGVLPFCGKKGYQLILARKSIELEGEDSEWGFTLVREKTDVSSEYKTTWYEYFTDSDGKIFRISGKSLKILPKNEKMEDGCFIKLYNYDLPNPSAITARLWGSLSTRLYSPALPISMIENRDFDTKFRDLKLYGNKYRIEKDQKKYVYKNFSISSRLKNYGTNKIDVTVFKHASTIRTKVNKTREFLPGGECVIMTQNGQTHNVISNQKFKSQTGFSSIANYVMIHIDLTNIPPTKAKMFMGNREVIRKSTDYKELVNRIFSDLSDDDQLKAINVEYTKLDDENSVKDSSMQDLLSKVIRKNKNIMKFLESGEIQAEDNIKTDVNNESNLKYIPTFLKLRGSEVVITHEKQIPYDGKWAYINFKTDAQNDYLTRDSDRGELFVEWDKNTLEGNEDDFEDTKYQPYNGTIKIKLRGKGIPGDKIGDLKVTLTRPNMEPLKQFVHLYFGQSKKELPRKPPTFKESGISIPEFHWIKRDDWDQFGWDENSVSQVDLQHIRINKSNRLLEEFKRNRPSEDGNKITAKFGFNMYMNSLMLYLEIKDEEEFDTKFNKAISASAKACLPLAYDFSESFMKEWMKKQS